MASDSLPPDSTANYSRDTDAEQPDGPRAVAECLGSRIGLYKLLQKLGEGGMGTVYLAEQEQPVRRRVALKVIKPGMDSAQVIARFEAERQALALMDHPYIAKIFDAGVTPFGGGEIRGGVPYVVMELVQGVRITKYCDDNKLTPRERLQLFVPVCQAIQHAHQKGIIHRDIKPSNVMVSLYDGKPVAKVIDFGLAKATEQRLTEHTLVTQIGNTVGTFEYMSPEQAEMSPLGIDTRSDIYSLGVLLYELLTGTTPVSRARLRNAPHSELLRIIKEEEPPKPSARISDSKESVAGLAAQRGTDPAKLAKLVKGELDWIVMRCLEKDRTRRYETASGLARDVERYLHDEPVEACPPSTGYRLRKYARKHRKVLASVGAFAAILVAATVTSISLASWALRERNQADQQKQVAEANFTRALEAVDQMLTRVGEAQLLHVPQMEHVRRDLLQDALRFYQGFLKESSDRPAVRSETASAYVRVGRIQVLLGQRDDGEAAFRQAVSLLKELLDKSPGDPALINKLAEVHNDLGLVYHSTQRWPEAVAALQFALTLLEPQEPASGAVPLNVRSSEDSMPLIHRYTLAQTYINLVVVYRQTNQLDEAKSAFVKCRTISESLLARNPKDVKSMTLLAVCSQNVGLVYNAAGNDREAEAAFQKALSVYQQLSRAEPDDVLHRKRLAAIHNNLGILYMRTREDDKAESALRESLALHQAIVADHPKVVAFMLDLAGSYGNLATHVRKTRSPEESLEWTAKAIEIVEPMLGTDPRYVEARMFLFDALMGRGYALVRLGRQEDAVKDWRRMIEISQGQPHINMKLYRPFALTFLGEHSQATAEIETLLGQGPANGRNLVMFASVHSLCSAVAAKDARLPPTVQNEQADKYGGRAVELLHKAQVAGYFQEPNQLTRLKDSKDLDAIRARPDFRQLMVELERGQR